MSNQRKRGEEFGRFVGLELKGRIVTQGFTAKGVADAMGRSQTAFNRWLNGKAEIPLAVLCEACELIDVEPDDVVSKAYDKLVTLNGERDGWHYAGEAVEHVTEEIRRLQSDEVTLAAWDARTEPNAEGGGGL